jgi:hypothetical protein
MSMSRTNEARYLDQEERTLVEQTHAPALAELADADLAQLIQLVRERRSRARSIASRQRREMRGKADPAGTSAARRNDGTTRKAEALAGALRRLTKERARRQADAALPDQVRLARAALRQKRAAERPSSWPQGRTAHTGMRPIENRQAQDLARPMEIGRVSQFVKNAQAKRDSRNG